MNELPVIAPEKQGLFKRILIALMADIHNRRIARRKFMVKNWRLKNIEKSRRQGRESMRRYPERNRRYYLARKALNALKIPKDVLLFKRLVVALLVQQAEHNKKRYRDWCSKNKDRMKVVASAWTRLNPDKVKVARLKFYSDPKNVEKRKIYNAESYQKNKPVFLARYRAWHRKRYKTDPFFRVVMSLRACLKRAVRSNEKNNKRAKIWTLIACPPKFFHDHIESLFEPWMNWDNYGYGLGKWVIDHIKPVASFNHADEEQQKKCWHYTNLRPLCWKKNMDKRDSIISAL
jgi:hypothetical protein